MGEWVWIGGCTGWWMGNVGGVKRRGGGKRMDVGPIQELRSTKGMSNTKC